VIVTNYLYRPLLPALVAALKPGGVLIYETFAQGNEALGKPSNPDFLLHPGELLDAVQGRLTVVAYERHGHAAAPRRDPENLRGSGEPELGVELTAGVQRIKVIAAADMFTIDEYLRHRVAAIGALEHFLLLGGIEADIGLFEVDALFLEQALCGGTEAAQHSGIDFDLGHFSLSVDRLPDIVSRYLGNPTRFGQRSAHIGLHKTVMSWVAAASLETALRASSG
jgi:hypothetical protein